MLTVLRMLLNKQMIILYNIIQFIGVFKKNFIF